MSISKIEKISYQGWSNCYRLSNREVDVIVTADIGPRIMRYGFVGDANILGELAETVGKTGGDEWRLYGGHRFWHAPEDFRRTYSPDNEAVEVYRIDGGLRLVQSVEKTTGIQKEIDLFLSPSNSRLKVVHRIRNTGVWPLELAAWGVTVMTKSGTVILPLPPRLSHDQCLQPTTTIALWSYTNMADPRWTWGNRYILLRQNPEALSPQKIGLRSEEGWVAYAHTAGLFLKRFAFEPGRPYPDLGCSVEVFADAGTLEVQTLGPLQRLEPKATVEHVEQWYLLRAMQIPQNDDDVDRHVLLAIGDL